MSQDSENCTALESVPVNMDISPKKDDINADMGLVTFFDFIKNFDTFGVKFSGWTFFALDRYKTIPLFKK